MSLSEYRDMHRMESVHLLILYALRESIMQISWRFSFLAMRLVAITFCANTSSMRLKIPSASNKDSKASSFSASADDFHRVEPMWLALSFCHCNCRVLTAGRCLRCLRGANIFIAPGALGGDGADGGGGGGGGNDDEADEGGGGGGGVVAALERSVVDPDMNGGGGGGGGGGGIDTEPFITGGCGGGGGGGGGSTLPVTKG